MEFNILPSPQGSIAELLPAFQLNNLDDFLDLMGNARYMDCATVQIHQSQLEADFFDLKNKKAGEILQKFSTYDMKLIIKGNFTTLASKALQDFIRESNRMGRIQFVEIGEIEK